MAVRSYLACPFGGALPAQAQQRLDRLVGQGAVHPPGDRPHYPSALWKFGSRFSRNAVTASLKVGRRWAATNSRIS